SSTRNPEKVAADSLENAPVVIQQEVFVGTRFSFADTPLGNPARELDQRLATPEAIGCQPQVRTLTHDSIRHGCMGRQSHEDLRLFTGPRNRMLQQVEPQTKIPRVRASSDIYGLAKVISIEAHGPTCTLDAALASRQVRVQLHEAIPMVASERGIDPRWHVLHQLVDIPAELGELQGNQSAAVHRVLEQLRHARKNGASRSAAPALPGPRA